MICLIHYEPSLPECERFQKGQACVRSSYHHNLGIDVNFVLHRELPVNVIQCIGDLGKTDRSKKQPTCVTALLRHICITRPAKLPQRSIFHLPNKFQLREITAFLKAILITYTHFVRVSQSLMIIV